MKAAGALVLAWVLFIASFFLPSVVKVGHGDFQDVVFSGWDAAVGSVLIGRQVTGFAEPRAILYYLWPLTNVVMFASALILSPRSQRLRKVLPHVMLLSAGLNGLPPLMAPGPDLVFKAGYYMWFTSFGLAAGALYSLRARSKAGLEQTA